MRALATQRTIAGVIRFPIVLIFLAAAACETTTTTPHAPEVRDSAGIVIITHRHFPADPEATARVDGAPELAIGDAGSGLELFRVVAAFRTSDGGVVIANGGDTQLLFLDRAGHVTRRVGRQGSGPGEFERLTTVRRIEGDTLLVWDDRIERVTILTPAGDVVDEMSLAGAGPRLDEAGSLRGPIGRVTDGGLIAPVLLPHRNSPEDGPGRDTVRLIRITAGADPGVLLTIAGRRTRRYLMPAPRILTTWVAPYAVGPSIVQFADTILVHNEATAEIRLYRVTGSLAVIHRGGGARRAFTQAQRERFIADSVAARGESTAAMWRAAMELAGFPDSLPAFARVHVGRDRSIWAEWPVAPGDTLRHWTLFRGAGEPDIVSGPVTGAVMDVGSDYVLLLMRDDLDVERIELRRVRSLAG